MSWWIWAIITVAVLTIALLTVGLCRAAGHAERALEAHLDDEEELTVGRHRSS